MVTPERHFAESPNQVLNSAEYGTADLVMIAPPNTSIEYLE